MTTVIDTMGVVAVNQTPQEIVVKSAIGRLRPYIQPLGGNVRIGPLSTIAAAGPGIRILDGWPWEYPDTVYDAGGITFWVCAETANVSLQVVVL